MQSNNEKNYLEWFRKAEDDALSINAILKEGGAFSTVCFLSQQMAEKYLKGLLVFFGRPFQKVHDLLKLETSLLREVSEIHEIHNELIILNRYYIETRYPGDYPEFTWKDAKEAYKATAKVKKFVLARIKC